MLLVLVPDVAVVLRSTLTAGRRRGALTTLGVVTCSALQGGDAAGDLGAVVVRSQPVFEAICWAGTAYWVHLGAQAVRSAVAGRYGAPDPRMATQPAQRLVGWRAGLPVRGHRPRRSCLPPDGAAVVPRGRRRRPGAAAVRAPHAALGLVYLLSLVATVHRTRHLVGRHPVRRALDAPTGVALLGFGVRLATEHG